MCVCPQTGTGPECPQFISVYHLSPSRHCGRRARQQGAPCMKLIYSPRCDHQQHRQARLQDEHACERVHAETRSHREGRQTLHSLGQGVGKRQISCLCPTQLGKVIMILDPRVQLGKASGRSVILELRATCAWIFYSWKGLPMYRPSPFSKPWETKAQKEKLVCPRHIPNQWLSRET